MMDSILLWSATPRVMMIPALMGAIRLTGLLFGAEPIGADDQIWFRLLVAFDVIFTILAVTLVDFVLVG